LSKKQATARNIQVKTFPRTVYTSAQLATAISKRIQTLYGEYKPYTEKRRVSTLSV